MDINVIYPISKALAAKTYAEAADILIANFPEHQEISKSLEIVERVLHLKMHIGSGEEAWCNRWEELHSGRMLDATCTKRAQDNIDDLEVYGEPDQWKLLSKASSESQGFMKSTKAMEVPGGVVIQVSTLENGIPAEALTFVPLATVSSVKDGGYILEYATD